MMEIDRILHPFDVLPSACYSRPILQEEEQPLEPLRERIRIVSEEITPHRDLRGSSHGDHGSTPDRRGSESLVETFTSTAEAQSIIQKIASEVIGVEPSKIDLKSQLTNPRIGADTLDIVEIVMEVEETFGIAVPDAPVNDPKTGKTDVPVQGLAEVVE